MIVVMPDKMNGENHSLVRLFLKSGFMKELDLTKGSVLKTLRTKFFYKNSESSFIFPRLREVRRMYILLSAIHE